MVRKICPLLLMIALAASVAGHAIAQQPKASRFAAPVAPQEAAVLKHEEDLALEEAAKVVREMEALAKTRLEKDLANNDAQIVAEIRRLVAQRQALRSPGAGPRLANTTTQQMQETQTSFNCQYLQLQNQMQNENRQYTAVSNIMKTKHDTVKNSISNIR
jgi:hypothetical protein